MGRADEVRRKVVKLALKETELSPRELAMTFTDKERYFVSEASTYRILKAHDLITSPAFIVIKAASEFKDKTDMLDLALEASGCNQVHVIHKSHACSVTMDPATSLENWLNGCKKRA